MKKILIPIVIILLVLSCQTTSNRVTRVSSDLDTDLSGRWNDTDSREVSQNMLSDLLSRSTIRKFSQELDDTPVIIVGRVRNLSSEHINVITFMKDLERELINSGEVKVVASSSERVEIRDEREDQQAHSTLESANRLAKETGADLMLIGSISSIADQIDDTRVVYYQVDLELISLENNEKLWIGSQKHKKIIDLGGARW